MAALTREDIRTTEVLEWRGIHLLHFLGSSCSQKTRIVLAVKGIEWESHSVDLVSNENYSEWFMGINPRGLVPVLVDDGKVIIESNDILEYLEMRFPEKRLILAGKDEESHAMLVAEDDLHLDLRALSMRYVFPAASVMRSEEALSKYANTGSGTVQGVTDPHKEAELGFFRDLQKNNGITDAQVRSSVAGFRAAFSAFDERLTSNRYLLGDDLSLIDIAWYIYSTRLLSAGYPLHRLHPRLGQWFDRLNALESFNREVQEPPSLAAIRKEQQAAQKAEGTSLVQVAGL